MVRIDLFGYKWLWELMLASARVALTLKALAILFLDPKEIGSNPDSANIIFQFYYFSTYTLYECMK